MAYDLISLCIYLRYSYSNLTISARYCLLMNRKEMHNLEFETCTGHECSPTLV